MSGTILLNVSDINLENVIVAVMGMVIVYIALILLYLFFRTIPKIIDWNTARQLKKKGELHNQKNGRVPISLGDEAAIGAALYLYLGEIHDEENTIMTIKKVSKTYSPWSSKLYSMRWPIR